MSTQPRKEYVAEGRDLTDKFQTVFEQSGYSKEVLIGTILVMEQSVKLAMPELYARVKEQFAPTFDRIEERGIDGIFRPN